MLNLSNFMQLSAKQAENRFTAVPLEPYSRGMGAIGLPGDLSSQSRFVRAAFSKLNSVSGDSEEESVSQFFHILGTVEQINGCCDLGNGQYEKTIYTSCCNTRRGIYYYKTYENHRICAVDMHSEDLDGKALLRWSLQRQTTIKMQNEKALRS
jgi:choloylglycine hydrolase